MLFITRPTEKKIEAAEAPFMSLVQTVRRGDTVQKEYGRTLHKMAQKPLYSGFFVFKLSIAGLCGLPYFSKKSGIGVEFPPGRDFPSTHLYLVDLL